MSTCTVGGLPEAAAQQPPAPAAQGVGAAEAELGAAAAAPREGAVGANRAQSAGGPGALARLQVLRRGPGDGAALGTVRRHMDALEERVHHQLASLRDLQQSSRLREGTLSRLEEKVLTVEGAQPKLDRRVAELTGNFQGLSDEMQAQLRRMDHAEERLHSWRRQLEEELRQRFVGLEQQLQRAGGSARALEASLQEGQRNLGQRLAAVEAVVAERAALQEEARERLEGLWERLAALEGQRRLEDRAALDAQASGPLALQAGGGEALAALDRRLADIAGRLDGALEDAQDVRARLAAQEQQQKALRTLVEKRDEHLHKWDGKFGLMNQAPGDCHERLRLAELRLATLEGELDGARTGAGPAPRAAALAAQLQELMSRAELHSGERPSSSEAQSPQDLSKTVEQLNNHAAMISDQAEKAQKALDDASAARRDLERLTNLADTVKLLADGIVGDLDSLKRDIASLAEAVPRREELREISGRAAGEASELRQELASLSASSSGTRDAVDRVSKGLADLRCEVQERAASGDGVKQEEFRSAVESVGQDMKALEARLGALAVPEMSPCKEDLARLAARLDEQSELIAEQALCTRQASAEASEAKRSAEGLLARWSADGAAGVVPEADVAEWLNALDPRLDALVQSNGAGAKVDAQQQLLVLEAARRVWENQESESKAHEQVLARIDELSTRLAALDGVAAAEEGGRPAVDLEHRYSALVDRMVEVQALHRQLEAKVEGLSQGSAAHAPTGATGEPQRWADGDAGGGCN